MDFIDRIAEFLRDLLGGDSSGETAASTGHSSRSGRRFVDPDVETAWEELDEYLGKASSRERASSQGRAEGRGQGRAEGSRRGGASSHRPLESLRQDYANLEVPFGADIETVRRSYKKLMLRYHPDKHGGSSEKLRVATEITKRINESFERIRAFLEDGTGAAQGRR